MALEIASSKSWKMPWVTIVPFCLICTRNIFLWLFQDTYRQALAKDWPSAGSARSWAGAARKSPSSMPQADLANSTSSSCEYYMNLYECNVHG